MIKAKYKLAMGEHSLEIRKNFVTIGMLWPGTAFLLQVWGPYFCSGASWICKEENIMWPPEIAKICTAMLKVYIHRFQSSLHLKSPGVLLMSRLVNLGHSGAQLWFCHQPLRLTTGCSKFKNRLAIRLWARGRMDVIFARIFFLAMAPYSMKCTEEVEQYFFFHSLPGHPIFAFINVAHYIDWCISIPKGEKQDDSYSWLIPANSWT